MVVTRKANTVRAEHDVLRLCHGTADVATLQHELLRSLRRLMPVDAAFFATADPSTLLFTGAYAEEPLAAATPQFLENEFASADVNKFASLATSSTHVASLDTATRHDRGSSRRYRDIMGPLGLGDELRGAMMVGGQCWGYLCLHREDHELGFTNSETALIARLGPHIADALRKAVLLHRSSLSGDKHTPGVVLLADNLSLVAITPAAEYLLSLIAQTSTLAAELPVAVYAVASALGALERGTAGPHVLPSVRVRTVAGQWLNVHASRLHGPPGEERIAVIVEPADARETIPLLLSAHGLTTREAQVARLVLRGSSTRTISETLHISPHTVQDHLKLVFDKVGVRSRRDLVAWFLRPEGSDRS